VDHDAKTASGMVIAAVWAASWPQASAESSGFEPSSATPAGGPGGDEGRQAETGEDPKGLRARPGVDRRYVLQSFCEQSRIGGSPGCGTYPETSQNWRQ
jgi:hypothetical protein